MHRALQVSRTLLFVVPLLVAGSACLSAADVETPVTAKGKAAKKAPSAEFQQMAQEEKWVFEPPTTRTDPFFDRENVLKLEADIKQQQQDNDLQNKTPANTKGGDDAIAFSQAEQERIGSLMANKRYDEVMKSADTTLKILEKHADLPEVQAAATRITTYRDQAEEALTRNEAQEQFDALGLRIEGILWSEGGSRLAIIAGEPRAVGVNERVKDCVIINIDTDRVDFRFHYKRKRFEFPRYVGEDGSSVAQKKTK